MSTFISINPATGKEIGRTESLDAQQLEQALARAQADFLRWRATPVSERAALLIELARQLELGAQGYAAMMSREMGKTFREALAEVKKCAFTARHFAEHGPAALADEAAPSDAVKSFVRYEPLGVILAIMPWNFPFWQLFRCAIPALLTGNVVLLKHAGSTLGCAAEIEEVFRKAGAPRGLLQSIPVQHEQIDGIIGDARVRALSLTGSTRAGRAVAAQCAKYLKPSVLELGGSDAFVVMPSCDLDAAVKCAVVGRVQNNGQSCIAAKRFIVHEQVYTAFEDKLQAAFEGLRMGDPMDESIDLGPLSSEAARKTLDEQVQDSIAAGARLVVGGRVPNGPGWYYPATILADIPDDAPAARDELFGPVAALFRVRDLEHALERANATVYGLGASIWTRDEDEAQRAIDGLQAGAVFVNGIVKSDARLPFGGIKESGWGRELSWHGLLAFTNTKAVWIK